jgi:hypothetical protein
MAELFPFCKKPMAAKNWIKFGGIQDTGLDELQDAGVIFGAPELESQGHKVFCSHDPRAHWRTG